MTGRPSEFSQEIADLICERIADGKSLRSICLADDMPDRATVFRWLGKQDVEGERTFASFRDQYARAREAQADALFEDILDIADDKSQDVKIVGEDEREVCNTEFVQRARLRVDARKWMAGKLAPKKYGDSIRQEHTGEGGGPIVTADLSAISNAPRKTRDALRQALQGVVDGSSER